MAWCETCKTTYDDGQNGIDSTCWAHDCVGHLKREIEYLKDYIKATKPPTVGALPTK